MHLTVPILLGAAFVCAAAAFLMLRSLGDRYRVGRLLAAAPAVEIDDAIEMAASSATKPSYVRVSGRISSAEEFPDENDRPLVFRRKRIDVADAHGGWRTIADEREAVPFGIETRSSFIAVDEAAIDRGLVAIPRVSDGRLSDLPADLTRDVEKLPAADTPARLVIEQLSAVEHATVCGAPVLRDGRPILTAGRGRPLVITTLDAPAAMRLLAAGQRPRVLASAVLFAAALAFLAATLVAVVTGL